MCQFQWRMTPKEKRRGETAMRIESPFYGRKQAVVPHPPAAEQARRLAQVAGEQRDMASRQQATVCVLARRC